MTQKEIFIQIYKNNITRPGADRFLEWLEKSDFFEAPASTKYHLSVPGGLCKHSIHVYDRLAKLVEAENMRVSKESVAIIGLLHDICKVNFYAVELRNRKNEQGQWEKYEAYTVEDQFPYGHGEKSVHIVSSFMKLTREEALAIRWHMGFSDDNFKAGGYSVGNAFEKCPLAVMVHIADLQATYLDETDR